MTSIVISEFSEMISAADSKNSLDLEKSPIPTIVLHTKQVNVFGRAARFQIKWESNFFKVDI